jgi:hypothetical protein
MPNFICSISSAFVAATLIFGTIHYPSPTLAGTCASKCGRSPIQFTPGQRIRIKVINSTLYVINLEKLHRTDSISLRPGQELQLEQGDGSEPNISLVFWDENGSPLQAFLSKPDFATLRVEIRPGRLTNGDRSVYIRDDGRVNRL